MDKIYKNIDIYYTKKLKEYGTTPQGVDWNGEESQFIRFEQLSKVIDKEEFSVTDLGCGYGKYIDYLDRCYPRYRYYGFDLSHEMVKSAASLYKNSKNVVFKQVAEPTDIAMSDYCIASGIFSVKMHHSEAEWLSYILDTLETMNKKSRYGFSFNMLTKYSDPECMREDLYYADPLFMFDYCKRNFSRNVSLLHDYNLYEFTILVRKD